MIYRRIYFNLRQKVRNGREGIFSALKNKMTLRKIRMKDLCVLMKNAEWKRRKEKGTEWRRRGVKWDGITESTAYMPHVCEFSECEQQETPIRWSRGRVIYEGHPSTLLTTERFCLAQHFRKTWAMYNCTRVSLCSINFFLLHLFLKVHCLFSSFTSPRQRLFILSRVMNILNQL